MHFLKADSKNPSLRWNNRNLQQNNNEKLYNLKNRNVQFNLKACPQERVTNKTVFATIRANDFVNIHQVCFLLIGIPEIC